MFILATTLALFRPPLADVTSTQRKSVDIFATYGLLGTWSPNCKDKPSARNPRVKWDEIQGRIVHSVTFDGATLAVVDEVGSATVVGDNRVMFTVIRNRKLFATVTIELAEGYLYIVRAVGADGRVIVDQGIEVSTGKPALVDERCTTAVS